MKKSFRVANAMFVFALVVSVLSFRTQTVFAAPARPILSSPGNNTNWPQTTVIELKWNAVPGATQYEVELWGGPYTTMVPCNWVNGTSCWIGTMWPGTMYWHVKARDASGNEGDWSDTWSFIIQGDGGGGGGGGGGGSTCTMSPVPGFSSDIYKLPMGLSVNWPLIIAHEYRAQFTMQYCDPLVTYNFTQQGHLDGLSINGPNFQVDFGKDLEPTGTGSTFVSTPNGILGFKLNYGNETNGTYPYRGIWYGDSLSQSAKNTYYDYEATHQFRNYLNVDPRLQIQIKLDPRLGQVSAALMIGFIYAAEYGKEALNSQATQSFMQFLQNSFIPALLQVYAPATPPLSLRSTSTMVYPATFLRVASPPAATLDLLHQRYGQLVDLASVGTLSVNKSTVSAYTVFSFDGDGFTPMQPVYIDFGVPGTPTLLEQIAVADSNGHISGSFEMPTPDKVALGTYLLSAVDYASLNNSINAVANGQAATISTYIAGTSISVVQDITPPTITINSPTNGQTFTRCDKPLVNFTVTDDLSGVKTVSASVDDNLVTSGTNLNVLFWNLGVHSLIVNATDKMDLPSQSQVNFSLIPSIAGSRCALSQFYGLNLIKNQGIYQSLDAKLAAAQDSLNKNQQKTMINQLQSLINDLNAQNGKGVNASAYNILNGDLSAILTALGVSPKK